MRFAFLTILLVFAINQFPQWFDEAGIKQEKPSACNPFLFENTAEPEKGGGRFFSFVFRIFVRQTSPQFF
jgi:hypothetical protein